MATYTNVCPGCQEAISSDRLSCPSCGRVLASMTRPGEATPAAGAYVPPASTPPAGRPLPARPWVGVTSAAPPSMATSPMPQTPALAGASAVGQPPVSTMTFPSVPSLALETGWRATVAGWLMVIGSAVAILGFLLPWSRTVIGAEGAGTYFDTWGIANPSHLLIVLALAVTLVLAVLVNPIPRWIRTCCVGLALGGLLVGLTWPYLLGPLGAGPGVMAILVGGVILGVAGVLDLVEARHVASRSAV